MAGSDPPQRILPEPGRPQRKVDVLALQEGPSGRIWAAATDRLYRLDGERAVAVAPLAGLTGSEPLATLCLGSQLCLNGARRVLSADGAAVLEVDSAIKDLFLDREGSLWIATARDGLYQLRPTAVGLLGRPEGLPQDNVYPVVEGPGGAVWIGSDLGIGRLRGEELEWWTGLDSLPFNAVWTVLADRKGGVWAGGDGGLCRLRNGRWVHVALPGDPQAGPVVRSLFEDRQGRIWMGADMGVFVFAGGPPEPVPGLEQVRGGAVARTILQASDGAVWIGTGGLGLFRVAEKSVEHIGAAQGLAANAVRALHEDSQGRLWAGTEGRGLCRISAAASAGRRIACIGSSQGLYDDGIHRILEDGLGRYWMSTNRGIFWVGAGELNAVLDGRQQRLDCRSYTEQDGMRNREANGGVQSAGMRASDGRLWFPTQAGLAIIDPRKARPGPPPVVVIDRVEAGELTLSRPAGLLELPLGVRDLTIAYTAPTFGAPDQVRFRQRLVGYDAAWVEVGGRREARYTNLGPGHYDLEVEGRSADGQRSLQAARLAITVPTYLWEALWFRAAALLALLAVLATAVQRRLHAHQRQRQKLELAVQERTRQIQEQKKATEQVLQTVRAQHHLLEEMSEAKMRFFANLSHELRTPLTLLLGPLREAIRQGRLPSQEESGMMLRNAVRLERLLDLIRDLQKIDAGGFRLRIARLDLAGLIAEVAAAFAPLADRKGVALACRVAHKPLPADADPEQIERMAGNLLSNAIRFTPPGGAVEICLGAKDGQVEISVSDDGPGISAQALPRVFERFFQADASATRSSEGMGIGLALARELARLHGGDIQAASQPGKGSRFVLRLPRFQTDPTAGPAPPGSEQPEQDQLSAGAALEEASSPARQAARSGRRRKTVLVVDDNRDIRLFVRHTLSAAWNVIEASEGRQAVRLARAKLPDLVLADVMMPGMDGFELARRLKGDPETEAIPIVFLTARVEERDQVEAFQAGADQYVTKPFSPEVLRTRLAAILEQRMVLRRRLLEEARQGAEQTEAPQQRFEEQVRRLIRRLLPDEDFGIRSLAAELALSRRQIYRRLAEEKCPPPAQLIREERLSRAAELLRAGEGTVSEVAYAVGFSSLAAFSRLFRDRYGHPPSSHRSAPS